MAAPVRVRIAPSPTGDPHVGTAYIGLINYCFAKRHGGQFILRIEDTDQSRCTSESAQAIYDSLRWLGLRYDEGPDVGGDRGPYVQSERVKLGLYRRYADQLVEQGDAYYCFCSERDLEQMRKRQKAGNEPLMYDRRHRGGDLAEAKARAVQGEAYVIRMKAPMEGESVYRDRLRKQPVAKAWKDIDDQVLLKSDGWPTYHLAAVVDDHLMGITHVIRAEEWLNSLPKHLWLNQKLGFTAPEYVHVGLLRNADKSKISKRKNPTSLRWYQQQGYLPEALLYFLALLGHSHPDGKDKFSVDEMIGFFDLDRINVTGPVFDLQKLRHLQGLYFRELPAERVREEIHRAVDSWFAPLQPLFGERLIMGSDFFGQAEPFTAWSVSPHPDDLVPKGLDKAQARLLFTGLQELFQKHQKAEDATWDATALEALVRTQMTLATTLAEAAAASDQVKTAAVLWQPKPVFMALRVAVTGRKETPPLFDTLALIPPARIIERLGLAQQRLK